MIIRRNLNNNFFDSISHLDTTENKPVLHILFTTNGEEINNLNHYDFLFYKNQTHETSSSIKVIKERLLEKLLSEECSKLNSASTNFDNYSMRSNEN